MTIRTRAQLKALFENGDQPDANAFIDLIDSFAHMQEALPAVSGAALTGIVPSEWVEVVGAPTYLTTDSFSQPGDLTETYYVSRRVKIGFQSGSESKSAVKAVSYDAFNDETTVYILDAVLGATMVTVYTSFFTPYQDGGAISPAMLGGLKSSEIIGLMLSNPGGLLNLVVEAGSCRSADDTMDITLESTITKNLGSAWAVGNNQGGRLADLTLGGSAQLCAVWLIERTDTGVVDMAISASFTAPPLPANYDKKRLIGAVCATIALILPFYQRGDYFRYLSYTLDVSDATLVSGVFELGTLKVPPNCLAEVHVAVDTSGSVSNLSNRIFLRPVGSTDSNAWHGLVMDGAQYIDIQETVGWMLVDENSQIEYNVSFISGVPSITINAVGFMMLSRSYI